MKCPSCEKAELKTNEELSRGMGNQSIQECPECEAVVLVSGEKVTQVWTPEMVYA